MIGNRAIFTPALFLCLGNANLLLSQPNLLRSELARAQHELDQNSADQAQLLKSIGLEEGLKQLAGFDEDFKHAYEIAKHTYELAKSGDSNDQLKAIEATGKLSGAIFKMAFENSPIGKPLKVALTLESWTNRLAQLGLLTVQAASWQTRIELLQQQLITQDDPVLRSQLQKIQDQLRGTYAEHQAYLKQLQANPPNDRPDPFTGNIMRDAASLSPSLPIRVAEGATIVDPNESLWKLSQMPEINPDALRALDCLRGQISDPLAYLHINCVRYDDDWSYVPLFKTKTESASSARPVGQSMNSGRSDPPAQSDLESINSQLLQLRREAARTDQMLQDAQSALDAQRASLHAQQAGTAASDSYISTPPDRSSHSAAGANSGQYPKAVDPIEGSWMAVTSHGCEEDLSTVPELRANGWNGTFTVRSFGGATFQVGNGGTLTKVGPGTYIVPNNGGWIGIVLRLNGGTLQVSGTYRYTGPLTGSRSCTMVVTARRL